jgi:pimeloyl-ACP methyl ester carboxylesterase
MIDRRTVRSADGTPIAVFSSGDRGAPPVVLVHGTTADHTTFRAVEPLLARRFAVHAIDRRGRGASGDGPAYAIEREFEDVAAVVDALAAETGRSVDVIGHSYGGRCGLGAALRTEQLRRLVVYEGAPGPAGVRYEPPCFRSRFETRLRAGDREGALETFFRDVVGMDDATIAAYRANPTWPVRAAAADTILRELDAETSPSAGLEALGEVRCPVLQILGGESLPAFRRATDALHERLADGLVVVIDGAAHAAHHTHVDAFVDAVASFLG